MTQLALFPVKHLRDRTLRSNHSARAEEFGATTSGIESGV
jgi:hypothetical protein